MRVEIHKSEYNNYMYVFIVTYYPYLASESGKYPFLKPGEHSFTIKHSVFPEKEVDQHSDEWRQAFADKVLISETVIEE